MTNVPTRIFPLAKYYETFSDGVRLTVMIRADGSAVVAVHEECLMEIRMTKGQMLELKQFLTENV